jgi:hypothetical protein
MQPFAQFEIRSARTILPGFMQIHPSICAHNRQKYMKMCASVHLCVYYAKVQGDIHGKIRVCAYFQMHGKHDMHQNLNAWMQIPILRVCFVTGLCLRIYAYTNSHALHNVPCLCVQASK